MTNSEATKLFGQEFVQKVNIIRKMFNAQKVEIVNEIQARSPIIEKQERASKANSWTDAQRIAFFFPTGSA